MHYTARIQHILSRLSQQAALEEPDLRLTRHLIEQLMKWQLRREDTEDDEDEILAACIRSLRRHAINETDEKLEASARSSLERHYIHSAFRDVVRRARLGT